MKSTSLYLAVILSATLFTACSKKHSDGDSAAPAPAAPKAKNAVDAKTELEAAPYVGACIESKYKHDEASHIKLQFQDGMLTQTEEFFNTADCTGNVASSEVTGVENYAVDFEDAKIIILQLTRATSTGYMYPTSAPAERLQLDRGGNKIVVKQIDGFGKNIAETTVFTR